MKRILVLGISGSGKSTLAFRLGKKLNLPVVHLDKYFWDVGWKERYPNKEQFNAVIEELVKKDEWIIDGNYRSSLDIRLKRADTIILLDFPKWLGLWRSFKRVFNRQQPFDKTLGVKEKIDMEHVCFVLKYDTNELRTLVQSYSPSKKVYIARNDRDKESILKILE